MPTVTAISCFFLCFLAALFFQYSLLGLGSTAVGRPMSRGLAGSALATVFPSAQNYSSLAISLSPRYVAVSSSFSALFALQAF
ncbi:hypothetical protein C8J56DRAFT_972958, partial [Mycena floridula]